MTEQEARDTMRAFRWSFLRRVRKGHTYVYAARKVHGRRREIYICSLASLEIRTVEVVVEKLIHLA
jgi:hypothetical protein